jgi:hypothetical protein
VTVLSSQSTNQTMPRVTPACDKRIRIGHTAPPALADSHLNPGYIKGYIPGVRENGGQYTHGAIWTALAFALLEESDRAWELFALLNPVHHGATPSQIAATGAPSSENMDHLHHSLPLSANALSHHHHATRRELPRLQSNIPRWTVSSPEHHPLAGRSPRPFY